jgi:mRNA-degrading endonuclease RelE of RelBE toxin-antitoxin system
MSFKVKSTAVFEKQTKTLSKKFPSVKNELGVLIQKLKEKPEQGTLIGKNCYKIRISIASKLKGKSGGARVITNIVISNLSV